MATKAVIAFFKGEFVASLSDGRHVERHNWREMAHALYDLGVDDAAVEYEWHTGQCMITAGQQVALRAEIRRLAHASASQAIIKPLNKHMAAA